MLESVYEAAFIHELNKRKIAYTRQQGISAIDEDAILDVGFRTGIIMENKLIVEIKSVERIERVHHKTVLTYLRLSGIKLAILVNFNVNLIKEGLHKKNTRGSFIKNFVFFFVYFVYLCELKT